MRISTNMMYANLIKNLAKATERTQAIQEVISTGRTINRHSDDPFGSGLVVRYQTDLIKLGQYSENSMHAKSWLTITDSLVLDMQTLLHKSKNIAIAQSSSTVSGEIRTQAAVEVQELYKLLINYGNTKLGGNAIFGGSLTNIIPFNPDGTYNGNGGDFLIEIQEGVATKVNLAGSEFLVTDLNPDLSSGAVTGGSTSSTGLAARNINRILASPSGLAENKVTFVLTNGLTEEVTYTTDSNPTQDELGAGIADAVNNHDTLNQYIRASYATGNITFEAKESGTAGNAYTIDAANTTAFEGTVDTTFAGGRSEITSGFVFNPANSDIVFAENGGADIPANIITDGGAVLGQAYTGDQVASFVEKADRLKKKHWFPV
jgi:flagellar hook-associated protein 3